jgi:hypothetical protein
MAMVDTLTGNRRENDGSLNLALDDTQLFQYPWPGCGSRASG